MGPEIWVGMPGSGKSLCATRLFCTEPDTLFLTNIIVNKKLLPNCEILKPEMIISERIVKKFKNGDVKKKYVVNSAFWRELQKTMRSSILNILIDELHLIADSRNSQDPRVKVITHWLTLIRKFTTGPSGIKGRAIFLTQDIDNIDIRFRKLASIVVHHKCHYMIYCSECTFMIYQNSDMAEHPQRCPSCDSSHIREMAHVIEIWKFKSWDAYERWLWQGLRTFYSNYKLKDMSKYFDLYDSKQSNSLDFEDDML